VINTVLRGAAGPPSVPPFSVVVDSTTLVTVAGGSVVTVDVEGGAMGVVGGAMGVLAAEAGTVVAVVRNVDALEVDEDWLDMKILVVAKTIPLLSSLGTPIFGTKMRGGTDGMNGMTLDAGAPLLYIVFVTTTVAIAATVVVVMLTLVTGAQAQPGSSCGRAIPPNSLPPVLT